MVVPGILEAPIAQVSNANDPTELLIKRYTKNLTKIVKKMPKGVNGQCLSDLGN